MKTTILSIIIIAFSLMAFVTDQKRVANSKIIHETITLQNSFSTAEIVKEYLTVKNALVKSDSKSAAFESKVLLVLFDNSYTTTLTAKQKSKWAAIAASAKKQTKVIISNNGNLDKQRMAFHQLSINMQELITAFGTSKKLYLDYCPMYGEGAIWISETKEITNPYFGKTMMTCGIVKETIQ